MPVRRDDPPVTITSMAFKEQGLGYRIEPHVRSSMQWYAVVYGAVAMSCAGRTHRLTANTAMLIPPDTIRSPRCDGRSPGYIIVEFIDHSLSLENRLCVRSAISAPLISTFHALVDELKDPSRLHSSDLAYALFLRLLIAEERAAAKGEAIELSSLNKTRKDDLAARIDLFLTRRLHAKLERSEIARAFGLSSSHCARLFRDATGTTMHERLTELRIERAKVLLREGTQSISDIALEVGFDSFSHFTRMFRSRAGVLPSDYRRSGGRIFNR